MFQIDINLRKAFSKLKSFSFITHKNADNPLTICKDTTKFRTFIYRNAIIKSF